MILVLVLGTISDNNVSATETHQSAVLTELWNRNTTSVWR